MGEATLAALGGDAERVAASVEAVGELFAFLGENIQQRRARLAAGERLPDDVLSALVTSEYEGSHFTDEEILMASHLFFVGGYETTPLPSAIPSASCAAIPTSEQSSRRTGPCSMAPSGRSSALLHRSKGRSGPRPRDGYPDHYPHRPGGHERGRSLNADSVELRRLGAWHPLLRPGKAG
jgi:hypothetical protein